MAQDRHPSSDPQATASRSITPESPSETQRTNDAQRTNETQRSPRRRKNGRVQKNDRGGRSKNSGAQHRERRARLKAARQATEVAITYPSDLPVSAARGEIAEAIGGNQVVIIAGETGSGKTTQLPKICLELGLGIDGMIGHTQPRRIAARTVAERIADELGEDLGNTIGYQVRFTARVADSTRVKVMTDGILLSELSHDKLLRDYEVIIIDEAHERSLNIDFLLGYLKEVLSKRPDLKVIITSATIDPESFAAHFDDAPIIRVEGRTYPVEVRYRPIGEDVDEDDDVDGPGESGNYETGVEEQTEGIIAAVDELAKEAPGDILVFLSGEREIRDTADALEAHLRKNPRLSNWEVVPLFARLSAGEQQKVFKPHSRPRIVLATNVAETSLTVPGIKYVIDVGTARISRYSNRTRVQRLPIERVSQASANQRKGRSGRTSDGICIRLYSEADFDSRPEFTDPEILRTNLASVILQMANLGFAASDKEILEFPFLTPPEAKAVRDGRTMLSELGALTSEKDGTIRVSDIGRKLTVLPIDPRLARMVIAGAEAGCGGEVTVIVAALSIQDPRERPTEVRAAADEKHARFTHTGSDFLSYLNLWNYLEDSQAAMTSSKFRRQCKSEFLNFVRIREWQDLVGQLRSLLGSAGIRIDGPVWRPENTDGSDDSVPTHGNAEARASSGGKPGSGGSGGHAPSGRSANGKIGFAELSAQKRRAKGGNSATNAADGTKDGSPRLDPHAAAIHRALLTGLLSMIGARSERTKDFHGARGTRFAIFPGSGLFKKKPDFVMAAELVETSRLWARTVAAIDPEWVVEAAGDLVTRQYSEPHWSTRAGGSMVHEKISLYGVTLVGDRTVGYGRFDPEAARDMFIRKGLIERDWHERFGFLDHNARVIAEAEELASRTRNRRVLDQVDALYGFYDSIVPATVTSAADFRSWWKKQKGRDSHILDVTTAILLSEDSEELTASVAEDFPMEWELNDGTSAKLRYSFEPGSTEDGVTVEIPASAVPIIDVDAFTWQVPGLREELVAAYIRSLPKNKRRYFVPAPDIAREILPGLTPYEGSLPEVLAAHLSDRAGGGGLQDLVPITVRAEDFDRERIPVHLRIRFRVVDGKKTVGLGEDLTSLTKAAAPQVRKAKAKKVSFASQKGLTSWPVEGLPDPSVAEAGAVPGLVDRGSSVDLVAFDTEAAARIASREALISLINARTSAVLKYLRDGLTMAEKLTLAGHQKSSDEMLSALMRAGVRGIVETEIGVAESSWVGSAAEFEALEKSVQAGLPGLCTSLLLHLMKALTQTTDLDKQVSKASSLVILSNLADVQAWRGARVSAKSVAAMTPQMIRDLPRWVRAESLRVDAMQDSPARDKQLMDRITGCSDEVSKKVGIRFPELVKADWSRILVSVPSTWRDVLIQVEELRVSLYANSLGTPGPVSEKRIAKALAGL